MIGATIKKLREERGLTQAAVAKSAKLTAATLNRLEKNELNVTVNTLQKILDVFGLDIAFKKKET